MFPSHDRQREKQIVIYHHVGGYATDASTTSALQLAVCRFHWCRHPHRVIYTSYTTYDHVTDEKLLSFDSIFSGRVPLSLRAYGFVLKLLLCRSLSCTSIHECVNFCLADLSGFTYQ